MVKVIAKNRRALFDYEVKDNFIAGIVLFGQETKSARIGEIDIKGAFVTIKDEELYLTNAYIKPYKYAGDTAGYDSERSRKLLLNKSEISRIIAAKNAGLTVVPLAIELHGKFIKVRIATARGKKKTDKRQTIQARDIGRDVSRELKNKIRK